MADVTSIIEGILRETDFKPVFRNPLSQFGTKTRRYLGAEILPEREVESNEYKDTTVRYKGIIANAGTRYSPSQKKSGVYTGSVQVELGDYDITSDFTASEYESLLKLISREGNRPSMSAVSAIVGWADVGLRLPHSIVNEKARWDAIVDASVVRTGDNNYTETVSYSNPASHRVNAAGVWSSDAYDPYDDIITQAELLKSKGYTVNKMYAGSSVIAKLSNNAKVQSRVGRLSVMSGTVTGLPGRASRERINSVLQEDGLPPITEYNVQYHTENSTAYFLKRDVFVLVATTGRDFEIVPEYQDPLIFENVLGYQAIGVPSGHTEPGIAARIEMSNSKPIGLIGESWMSSIPVILEPEAIAVIKNIT